MGCWRSCVKCSIGEERYSPETDRFRAKSYMDGSGALLKYVQLKGQVVFAGFVSDHNGSKKEGEKIHILKLK